MPKFNIAYARIEHQIFSFEVTANSEEDARMQVETVMEAADFDWLNYEIVHADEFVVNVEQQPALSRDSF